MKIRLSMKTIMPLLLLLSIFTFTSADLSAKPEYYQVKIYHFTNKNQESTIDQFLKDAYLPAMHRLGIKQVGVFKPLTNDTASKKMIFILIPFRSLQQSIDIQGKLLKDKKFQEAGNDYIKALPTNPPYSNIENYLLEAFSGMESMRAPKFTSTKEDRIYELRRYEAATEALSANKVAMFNKGGEINIFERLGFNAVFYGKVLFGGTLPSLMYMTSFENMDSRNKHWDSFRTDSEWKTLSAMEEYKGNFLRADTYLCKAAEYSDL